MAFGLRRMFCFCLAAVAFLTGWGSSSPAENTVEYSRITLGGGHSAKERYKVNASMTRSTGSSVQAGSRFEVTNVKGGESETTAAKGWTSYR